MHMNNTDDSTTPLRPAKAPGNDDRRANARNIEAEIASLDDLAHWLDSKFAIPGTEIRFGLDSILGLVPGVGDTLTAIPAGHIILSAMRLGAPAHVIAQMLVNLGVDTVIGLVPLLGDLLDVGFKGNRRNVTLLRRHFGLPDEPTARR